MACGGEVLLRGLPIPRYPHLKMGLPAPRALLRLWSLQRPDLVHIVTEGPLGWSALQAARKLRLPVSSDFRTNFHAYGQHYGLVGRKPLPDIDDAFFDAVHDLNTRSALATTRAALPHLKASAQGSGQSSAVILVGSIAAYLGGGPGAGLYGAAKAWLHNIQKNWVTYHTADGIRFNTVSPGTFDTAFHADKDAATKDKIAAGIPMKRLGQPAECAPAFLFLASHAASGYITGQALDVNGGQFMP